MTHLSTDPEILEVLYDVEIKSTETKALKELITQIRVGLKNGFSIKEIKLYANFELNYAQRSVVITSLAKGFSHSKMKYIVNLGLSSDRQMTELVRGFEKGLLFSDAKKYDWPKFSTEQINLIISGILDLPDKSKVYVYAKPEYTIKRMMVIHDNLKLGEYTDRQIEICTSENLIDAQIDALFSALRHGGVTEEQLATFAKPEFNKRDISTISWAYFMGWSKRKIKLLLNPLLNTEQREEVYASINSGIKLKYIQLYAKEQISHEKMKIIRLAIENKYSQAFIQELIDSNLNSSQILEIERAVVGNISEEYIKIYMMEPWDDLQIRALYDGIILKRLSISTIDIYANKEYTGYKMSIILEALTSGKISEDTIKKYVNMDFDGHQLKYIFECIENPDWWEVFKPYVSKKFSVNQMREILKGVKAGLNKEQIALYAKTNINCSEMIQISNALKSGVAKETVELVINLGIHWKEMQELFETIRMFNIPYDQATVFVRSGFTQEQYYYIFKGLFKDLSVKEVKLYAQEELSSKEMEAMMEKLLKEKRVNNLIWLATEK